MPTHGYTCSFAQIGLDHLGSAGGKGASLGELVRNGFTVPDGFCVTAAAYARFIEASSLGAPVFAQLEGLDIANIADLEARAAAIRALLTEAPIPAGIAGGILDAYHDLQDRQGGDLGVAVRSSATAEDLPGASFAGQQDTYLNVRGDGSLLDHVRRCWASLWTARAILYREKNGFAHGDVSLAVVVQEMFPSEVSGVMFTVNPVTSDVGEIIVNASWGLGEAIAGGHVNPDQFVVDRRTQRITARIVNDKTVMIVPGADGTGVATVAVPGDKRHAASLSDEMLLELARLGQRIEAHYGYPQDVEWGFARGRLAVLQSREVTGVDVDFAQELETWNRCDAETDRDIVWTRAWGDMFQTGPQSPLMYSIHNHTVTRAFDAMYRPYGIDELTRLRIFRWHHGRLYYNTAYEKVRVQLWPRFTRTEDILRFFPPAEWDAIRALPFRFWRKVGASVRLRFTAPQFSLRRCIDTFYRELPQDVAFYRQSMSIDFGTASFEEILTTFQALEDRFVGYCIEVSHALIDHAYSLVLVLTAMLRRWCGDEKGMIYGALASGLPRNRTVQENIDVWKLSRQVRNSAVLRALFESSSPAEVSSRLAESAEGAAFRATLDTFLAEYGHRGGSERDLAYPRWRHKPELLLGAIKTLISADDSHDPELTEAKLMERRRATVRDCLGRVRGQRWGFVKLPLFRFVLRWSEKYFLFRDDERFYADYFMTARHDFALAMGRRLADRGIIGAPADVFSLALDEVVDAWQGKITPRHVRIRVRARQAIHEKFRVKAPPMLLRGMHSLDDEAADDADDDVLRGIAASGGRVTARARVCHSLEETGKVGKGDILVACATDPGWTPVFSVLGGVVIETGGILAHATLVSREYGIPCVMNVSRATEKIRDGQIITIDGDTGRVILGAADAPAGGPEPATVAS